MVDEENIEDDFFLFISNLILSNFIDYSQRHNLLHSTVESPLEKISSIFNYISMSNQQKFIDKSFLINFFMRSGTN